MSIYVCIDGTFKNVEKASMTGKYAITLYKYDQLFGTLYVSQGSSITLPTMTTVQDDDIVHYGWTTTAGSTEITYTANQTITPTSNLSLYAVYQYGEQTTASKTVSVTTSNSAITTTPPSNQSITITDAVPGSEYTVVIKTLAPTQKSSPISGTGMSGTAYYVEPKESTTTNTYTTNNGEFTITATTSYYSMTEGNVGGSTSGSFDYRETVGYYDKKTVTATYTTYVIPCRSSI